MVYLNQHGYGLPAYRGVVMQRGYGLGGLFRGLVRAVAPSIKQGLKNVGKRALKTGLEVLTDVSQGNNIKSSLNKRSIQNLNELFTPKAKRQKTSSINTGFISKRTLKQKGGVQRKKKKTKGQTRGVL